MKIITAILFGILLLFGQPVVAQNSLPPKTLTLAQQQEDFKIFRGSLEEIHVGLNWFISAKDLSEVFDKTYNSLTDDTRTEDFYLKLRRIMASLRHGHNDVVFPQEYGVNFRLGLLEKDKKFLPFAIRILDKRIFVAVNLSANKRLAAGTEIVSINGEAATKIIEKQLPLIAANGRNETFKIGKMEGYYEFHYLYRLMNPGVERFNIEAIPFNSKNQRIFEIEAEFPETIAGRYKKIEGKDISDYNDILKYRGLDDKKKIAYVKLGSFYSGLAKDYQSFLDKTFTAIKQTGIRHLIVDLRQNEGGGEGFWQMAYTYTTGNSLPETDGLMLVGGDKFSYFKFVENPSPEFRAFANNPYDVIDKISQGRFRLKPQFKSDDSKTYQAPPNAFSGNLYVLTDGMTFSAAANYVATARRELRKQNRFIKFIGEAPGDDFDSGVGSAGTAITVLLPNSKIKAKIPLLGGGDEVPYSNKEKIVIPDYRVLPTAKDIAIQTDAELNFTIDLIKKKFSN